LLGRQYYLRNNHQLNRPSNQLINLRLIPRRFQRDVRARIARQDNTLTVVVAQVE
jgi:hypothetical protein